MALAWNKWELKLLMRDYKSSPSRTRAFTHTQRFIANFYPQPWSASHRPIHPYYQMPVGCGATAYGRRFRGQLAGRVASRASKRPTSHRGNLAKGRSSGPSESEIIFPTITIGFPLACA
jgi:hypothetical protein